ncbi:tripartite tricarboxylate transporter permease [Deinococcus deserti]|uniref:DUF112 domain-containing protein n=1 Tax=Deinococcus deserti (strain DSM 17065 / CIP 109153 / LMG 22923 / VCD115) TaxID=546414 RepID=C1D3K1_DEIDV|nr:tripartite tricarboxylate transporter permease [Deinococcus deserti]ACO48080.1 Conserved hypothetical protein; putative membrane protein [Deinococcus deserti VCD115]
MESFTDLLLGFSVALRWENLLYALVGSILGTLIGVLPGIGPVAGTALLIPLTFDMPAVGAIIMLTSLFYGTAYGGTITSVLLNVPGEAASAVTAIDGHQMAKKGRAGAALAIAAIGSFVGGTVATIALVFAAGSLARLALNFGPVEFAALTVLGLSLLMGLAGKSLVKGLMMGLFGLLLALVGLDPVQGLPRFTFGHLELLDGLSFVAVVMGLFGLSEIMLLIENRLRPVVAHAMSSMMLSRQDVRDSTAPILRGSVIGTALGLVPGMTGSVSSLLSYVVERKSSKHPERFGTGAIEGVAGPETANNAHANGALIPLFTLGIPASPTVAVLMGAFLMKGLVPGPLLFTEQPELVWGVIASFYVGNIILLILNLPLIGIWVRVLLIPQAILIAIILALLVVGAYTINNSVFDIYVMLIFGVIGYLLRKLDYPIAPIILALVLGPLMERSLRQSLELSQGSAQIFLQSPIALTFLIAAALVLLSPTFRPLLTRWQRRRA